MNIKAMKTIPSRQEEYTVETRCDLCNHKAPRVGRGEWGGSCYDIAEVTIEMRIGSGYPEGGSYERNEYHVCPVCFRDKVMVWLSSEGATETTEEVDW